MRHGMAVYAQIQQTVACNASHTVESRLARCLLQTRDLAGCDKLLLTQESRAQTIGARRNSVSLVANMLQQANFVHYSRGQPGSSIRTEKAPDNARSYAVRGDLVGRSAFRPGPYNYGPCAPSRQAAVNWLFNDPCYLSGC
jgi:hypothetical protein